MAGGGGFPGNQKTPLDTPLPFMCEGIKHWLAAPRSND